MSSVGGPRLSRRLFTGTALSVFAGCGGEPPSRRPVQTSPALLARLEAPRDEFEAAAPTPLAEAPGESAFPLFEAYPRLRAAIPREPFGLFPTPIERAEALGQRLGIGALYVKRDDVSGALYGGGKTRKLELFLGEARRGGHATVITFGAVGSHHAVATAAYADALGMKAHLRLLPQPSNALVREALLADLRFGATIRLSPGLAGAEAAARRELIAAGDRSEPYVIPVGGSSPIGNVAFVNAAFELQRDVERGLLPEPDVIYLALGTMGSAVGLALGLAALGMKTRVVAVRASSPGTSSAARLRAMIATTRDRLCSLDPAFPAVDPDRCAITIAGGQLGAGYGRSTRRGLAAIGVARELAGLALEPTYTAKALAALIEDAGSLAKKVVLFWNTQSSRRIDVTGVDIHALPAELRGYFPEASRR